MKRIISIGGFILIVMVISHSIATGANVPTLLKEKVGPDQQTKYVAGRLTVISTMTQQIVIAPKIILVQPGETLKLDVMIFNTGDAPLEFSMENLKAYSGRMELKFLTEEEMIEEIKQEYSASKMKLNKAQAKALEPFIEAKINILQGEILRKQTIEPQGKVMGLAALKIPSGKKELTIEVKASKDTHRFNFNLVALQ
ncbi:MAG: hypothetical protein JRG97_00870 [Deltaproteobacteria bacterium]|nr:hypothetical protein [Deltaproteobacteria bacterium]MBW2052547.1 hypothetical protein [Deltaproteobacteria bacterium]MBW2139608.1 hypothetical protein [Deltaproteobacteria bacterium]MBW2323244.1 hypothetical protein [Deltaproteobacteria bacterium]